MKLALESLCCCRFARTFPSCIVSKGATTCCNYRPAPRLPLEYLLLLLTDQPVMLHQAADLIARQLVGGRDCTSGPVSLPGCRPSSGLHNSVEQSRAVPRRPHRRWWRGPWRRVPGSGIARSALSMASSPAGYCPSWRFISSSAEPRRARRRLGGRRAPWRPFRNRSIRSATLRRAVARAVGFRVMGGLDTGISGVANRLSPCRRFPALAKPEGPPPNTRENCRIFFKILCEPRQGR